MEFKWNVTVDFPVSSSGHNYEDDEEKMNKAIIAFQNAQEAFFSYLDGSDSYEYEVLNDESK
jgi:hypothetical protein